MAYRPKRDIQPLGDLLERALVEKSQNQYLTMLGRELGNGETQRVELLVRDPSFGRRRFSMTFLVVSWSESIVQHHNEMSAAWDLPDLVVLTVTAEE